jgi:hypothetical protein
MAHRTQIILENEQHRRAKSKAAELGISLAEYIRRLVERDLAEPDVGSDASAIYDLGHGGATDVGRDKDAMLGEAVAEAPPA